MSKDPYYTSVLVRGDKVLYRGISENGKRISKVFPYSPTLYINTDDEIKSEGWRSHLGKKLVPISFESMKAAKKFVGDYEKVQNFSIFGQTKFQYAFINEYFNKGFDWNINDLLIATIDIEVDSENGFPSIAAADQKITAITLKLGKTYYVFGLKDFVSDREDIVYRQFRSEYDMLVSFLILWKGNYPDIITGWYIRFFDMPYLIKRIARVLGEEQAKKMSPWGMISEREVVLWGKSNYVVEMGGIASLDLYQLFRKFAPNFAQESYKLDHIAKVILNERKVSYDDYDSLHELYVKDHQKFIEYNITDVELVAKIDAKMKLILLALIIAYGAKINFDDVFSPVRIWETIIFNHLQAKKIAIPPKGDTFKSYFEGAFVKETQIGMFDWATSFDLTSEYPRIIMQYNISPETLVQPEDLPEEIKIWLSNNAVTVDTLLHKKLDLSFLEKYNLTMTPNGQFYRKDIKGFIPEVIEIGFNERNAFKVKMLEAEKALQTEKDPIKKKQLEDDVSRYNTAQSSTKIKINALYGALANIYFLFYDVRLAESVTHGGQLSIQWAIKNVNLYMNRLLKTNNVDYIIASDTDSIYVNMSEIVTKHSNLTDKQKIADFLVKVCNQGFQPFIQKKYEDLAKYMNAYMQGMDMKREVIASPGIWTGKKHYILNMYAKESVRYDPPKQKITGIEAIKSSTPAICREKISEAIKIIMSKDNETLIEFIEKFRTEFKTLPAEEIAFPRGLSGMNEYMSKDKHKLCEKATPIHVRGAVYYNHYLKEQNLGKKYDTIKEGEKLKFLYLKEPNHFQTHVIAFSSRLPKEFGLQPFIDYDTQFDKAFVEPIKSILDCIGWHVEKISNLDSFFG